MAIKISGTTVIDNSRALVDVVNISGTYNDFAPNVSVITTQLDFAKPLMTLTMSGNVTFTATGFLTGRVAMLRLDTSASAHTPSFPASIEFSPGTPTWSNSRYWNIAFICTSGSIARAFAVGFSA